MRPVRDWSASTSNTGLPCCAASLAKTSTSASTASVGRGLPSGRRSAALQTSILSSSAPETPASAAATPLPVSLPSTMMARPGWEWPIKIWRRGDAVQVGAGCGDEAVPARQGVQAIESEELSPQTFQLARVCRYRLSTAQRRSAAASAKASAATSPTNGNGAGGGRRKGQQRRVRSRRAAVFIESAGSIQDEAFVAPRHQQGFGVGGEVITSFQSA